MSTVMILQYHYISTFFASLYSCIVTLLRSLRAFRSPRCKSLVQFSFSSRIRSFGVLILLRPFIVFTMYSFIVLYTICIMSGTKSQITSKRPSTARGHHSFAPRRSSFGLVKRWSRALCARAASRQVALCVLTGGVTDPLGREKFCAGKKWAYTRKKTIDRRI